VHLENEEANAMDKINGQSINIQAQTCSYLYFSVTVLEDKLFYSVSHLHHLEPAS
jgi:hypothetical protein